MTKYLLLLCLLVSVPAHAQDTTFRISMVTAMAAHGADLATTEHCLGAGLCHELNPFLLRFNQPATFGAVKMGVAALQLWGVAKIHERWPKAATTLNFVTTGIFSAIAAHNARQ